jgi:hypothetical protein
MNLPSLEEFYSAVKSVGTVLTFLAPVGVWFYKEMRSRSKDRMKTDFELLKLCREAIEATDPANRPDEELKATYDAIKASIVERKSLFKEGIFVDLI